MEGNFLSMSEYVIVIQNIPLGSKMTPLGSMRVKQSHTKLFLTLLTKCYIEWLPRKNVFNKANI